MDAGVPPLRSGRTDPWRDTCSSPSAFGNGGRFPAGTGGYGGTSEEAHDLCRPAAPPFYFRGVVEKGKYWGCGLSRDRTHHGTSSISREKPVALLARPWTIRRYGIWSKCSVRVWIFQPPDVFTNVSS